MEIPMAFYGKLTKTNDGVYDQWHFSIIDEYGKPITLIVNKTWMTSIRKRSEKIYNNSSNKSSFIQRFKLAWKVLWK
tara:strand:+ start:337 stop:567 length:231 start_codon:yes stop_codon:yes gene_type:complete